MTAEIKIRNATLADAREIAVIHVKSWQRNYGHILPQSFLDELDVNVREKYWHEFISANGLLRVITIGDQLLGFCSYEAGDLGEIVSMYIHPDVCGKGLGKILIKNVIAHLRAQGCSETVLWTATLNVHAQKFYEHLGFVATGLKVMDCVDGKYDFEKMRYSLASQDS